MIRLFAALALTVGLAGCVVAPPYGYGYAPAYGYYAAPGYYYGAPSVAVGFGGGWHGR
jgi:hypothetical protein